MALAEAALVEAVVVAVATMLLVVVEEGMGVEDMVRTYDLPIIFLYPANVRRRRRRRI